MSATALVATAASMGCNSEVILPAPHANTAPQDENECSNVECTAITGEPSVCCGGRCVPVATTQCQLIGEAEDDRTVLFGHLVASGLSPDADPYETSAVSMAYKEMMDQKPSESRPFALVECTYSSSNDVRDSIEHLGELCTPALLPGSVVQTSPDTLASTAKEHEMLLMGGMDVDALGVMSDLDWFYGVARARYLSDSMAIPVLLPKLDDPWGNAQISAATVSVEFENTDLEADALEGRLEINGVDTPTNEALGTYRRFIWTGVVDENLPTDVASFGPNIVFLLSYDVDRIPQNTVPTTGEIMTAIEAAWPNSVSPPLYVVMERPNSVLESVAGAPSLAARVIAAETMSQEPDPAIAAAFASRFAAFTGNAEHPSIASTVVAAYDATYLLGTAAGSLDPKTTATAAAIYGQLRPLNPPGTRFAVAPDAFGGLLAALAAGKDVDLEGASGPLTYPPDVECYCISPGRPPTYQPAGLRYLGVTDEAMGELAACP